MSAKLIELREGAARAKVARARRALSQDEEYVREDAEIVAEFRRHQHSGSADAATAGIFADAIEAESAARLADATEKLQGAQAELDRLPGTDAEPPC